MPQDESAELSWVDRPEEEEQRRDRRKARRQRHRRKVRRRRRLKNTGIILGIVATLLLVFGLIWFQLTLSGLQRMPAVAGQTSVPAAPGTTMLLVGSNPEEPVGAHAAGWQNDLATSDLVMVMHLTADGRRMFMISIPGRSIVDIPGHSPGTLSTAYAAGGAPLYVASIESMIGARLDRVATLNLNAFREITDLLGGTIVNIRTAGCGLPAGPRLFDGQQALDFITLQPCLPRGDLDRVARQQSLMKALIRGVVDSGELLNPFSASRLLKATAGHLTLEQDFSWPSVIGTLWSLRHVSASTTTFLTVPVAAKPLTTIGGGQFVRLDRTQDAALWQALRQDRLAEYVSIAGADLVGG